MAGASEREKEGEKERAVSSSSRPLHNFTLPSRLQWGNQRHLRCVKVPHRRRSSTNSTAPSADHHRQRSNSPIPINRRSPATTSHKNIAAKSPITTATNNSANADAAEIEAIREKLMSHLKVAADQMKLPILETKEKEISNSNSEKKVSEEKLPWNLRTRRTGGRSTNEGGNAGSSPLWRQEKGLRSLAAAAADRGEGSGSGDQQRPKFSLTLSKEEIEADFLLMTGAKPPRRSKKRPKAVQKQVDVMKLKALFPGSWLTEVTPENYKVPEVPEPKGEK